MKCLVKISFLALLFILFFSTNALSLDKYYLLAKSNIAKAEGRTEDAIQHLQEYIETHPTTTGRHFKSYHNKKQYYIRNLLIAYANLFDLFREMGETEEVVVWSERLKSAYLSDTFRAKNIYTLGRILSENNLTEDAVAIFKEVIREQKDNYFSYNNKAMLRACSKLCEIYQAQQNSEAMLLLLKMLKDNYPNSDFDLNDKYRLASLYIEYGAESDGEELLQEIIFAQVVDSGARETNALIKTYAKLMILTHKHKDAVKLENLTRQISRYFRLEALSPGNMYKLAVTCLKCEKAELGRELLVKIKDRYPDTTHGRKALFLLGREAQSREDWDAAIAYFAGYVNRHPSPPFFALKAYSRLIDSYWARDADIGFIKNEAEKLADIVNGISDFETQLNMARDFKWKGFDELASATFSLGLVSAKKFISRNRDNYDSLRAHWLISKYADDINIPEEAELSARQILKTADKQKHDPGNAGKKDEIEYIKSQAYLALARIYRDRQELTESEKFLDKFISDYPDHKEIPYARYERARIYEETMRPDKAVEEYRAVSGENMWKKKAAEALNRCVN